MITTPTTEDLKQIGKWERKLMWSCVAMIGCNILIKTVGPAFAILALPVLIFQLYTLYRFASAAKIGWLKWVLLVLAIVPLIGLIAIVLLVTRVNRLFKDRGIPVGLMGPELHRIPG